MKPETLLKKIDRAARAVDAFLIDFINRDEQIPKLHEGMIYALGLDKKNDVSIRGKRLRPALGMLACEALGQDPKLGLPFFAAVELFHNFTLVHDDIEDGDTFRRNRPCTYMKFGMAHGINIGDFMLVKVFGSLMDTAGPDIPPKKRLNLIDLMIDTLEHTHVGQALDINARFTEQFTIADYFRLVTEKTGYCLAAPMEAATILAGASRKVREAIGRYARAVGPLFQIRDDMIDLTEGKGRKCVGSDIREGKRSYLVAHVTSHCTEKERKKLYRILDAPRDKTRDPHVDWVIELFKKYGSFEAAEGENERLFSDAFEAIAGTPPKLRKLLDAFARLLVERKR